MAHVTSTVSEAEGISTPTGRTWSTFLAGPLAGVAGGLAMAGALVVAAAANGMAPLAAIEPMGATLRDPATVDGGAGTAMLGLVVHLAVSALVGAVIAGIVPRDHGIGNATILWIGLAFVILAVMTLAIVPTVNPALDQSFHGLGGSWVLAHALYGATGAYACQRLRRGVRSGATARPPPAARRA